jgi:2-polyprenyl-3-methyl-5-hydroxy-6-metoxy-1,4-benzoquinol methylase
MKQWYEELFENYGKKYEDETFTRGTIGECDFLEKELNENRGLTILDLGCGTGRHSIEMSRRGYQMTGVDLSESMLAKARENAAKAGLEIKFMQGDARNLTFENEFDVVIMLCEGAFPLMETDEMNYEILENAAKALKAGGKFIFTTLNGLFPLFHSVEDFINGEAEAGTMAQISTNFNLMTFRDDNLVEITDDNGKEINLRCNERYYVPSEITWLLKSLKFNKIEIFGAKLGAFSRNDILKTEDYEMLVIAEK